jgi:hypothetical protein
MNALERVKRAQKSLAQIKSFVLEDTPLTRAMWLKLIENIYDGMSALDDVQENLRVDVFGALEEFGFDANHPDQDSRAIYNEIAKILTRKP